MPPLPQKMLVSVLVSTIPCDVISCTATVKRTERFDGAGKVFTFDGILLCKVPSVNVYKRNRFSQILAFRFLLHYCFMDFYLNLFIWLNNDYTLHFTGIVIFMCWQQISTQYQPLRMFGCQNREGKSSIGTSVEEITHEPILTHSTSKSEKEGKLKHMNNFNTQHYTTCSSKENTSLIWINITLFWEGQNYFTMCNFT